MERDRVGTITVEGIEAEALGVIGDMSGIVSVPDGVAMVIGGRIVRVMGYAEMWGE